MAKPSVKSPCFCAYPAFPLRTVSEASELEHNAWCAWWHLGYLRWKVNVPIWPKLLNDVLCCFSSWISFHGCEFAWLWWKCFFPQHLSCHALLAKEENNDEKTMVCESKLCHCVHSVKRFRRISFGWQELRFHELTTIIVPSITSRSRSLWQKSLVRFVMSPTSTDPKLEKRSTGQMHDAMEQLFWHNFLLPHS